MVQLKPVLEIPTDSLPPGTKTRRLIDFVSLKPEADQRLQKLISNIFCNVILVDNYDIALTIAQKGGFTCVTPELQVVYPGAFITKVGSQGRAAINAAQAQSRLSLYQKIKELSLKHLN